MIDPQNIRSALASADEEIRIAALKALQQSVVVEKQALLFAAMGDENWRVRKEAVAVYVQAAPDQHSIKFLLELLRDDDNAGLRNSAAEAAVRLGSAAVPLLISLIDDYDAEVRKFVIDIMGAIAAPAFVPSLLRSLHDPDVIVASAAAEQLGVLGVLGVLGDAGDTGIAEPLMEVLSLREEDLFRFSVQGALQRLAVAPKAGCS